MPCHVSSPLHVERSVRISRTALPHLLHAEVYGTYPAGATFGLSGTGAVFSVIPPENATGNFTKIVQRVPVRIALDDGAASLGEIRPGLSTTVSVDTRPAAQAGK